MLVRYILLSLLVVFLARALSRLFAGFVEGVTGIPRGTRVPQRGVQMVRDPVCGTFVVPDRAVTLVEGSQRVHFCSDTCRDHYRARPSTRSASSGSTVSPVEPSTSSGRPEPVEGRIR